MGLFSSKPKTDPAAKASQKRSDQIMDLISQQSLPALPGPAAATLNVPSALPAYLGGGAATTYPAGLPNQLSMIANQLTEAGYGAPDMSQYHAQTVAPYVPPPPPPAAGAAPTAPAAPATPTAPAVPVAQAAKARGFTGTRPTTFPTLGDFTRFLAQYRSTR